MVYPTAITFLGTHAIEAVFENHKSANHAWLKTGSVKRNCVPPTGKMCSTAIADPKKVINGEISKIRVET